MESKTVKELKGLAKGRNIKGYYRMRKAELIEALGIITPNETVKDLIDFSKDATQTQNMRLTTSRQPTLNILDQPIPEINLPILRPSQPPQNYQITELKKQASKATTSVKKEINEFADWILSYVPEPIKNTVNERVDSLKKKVNRIFERVERFTPKEHKTALKGYLKTFRIDGEKGIEPKMFVNSIKPKVLDLIKHKKNLSKSSLFLPVSSSTRTQLLVRLMRI